MASYGASGLDHHRTRAPSGRPASARPGTHRRRGGPAAQSLQPPNQATYSAISYAGCRSILLGTARAAAQQCDRSARSSTRDRISDLDLSWLWSNVHVREARRTRRPHCQCGLWMSPSELPGVVRTISPFLPTRQFGELLWSIVTPGNRLGPALGLCAYAAIFGALTIAGYRRDEHRRYA